MTTSYKEYRSRIIFVFVILLLFVSALTVQAQADSLRAIKLKNQIFVRFQSPDEKSYYLPSSYTYNLNESSHYQNQAYFRKLYSPSKETFQNVLFNLVGTGMLTYFGDQTNRNYISPDNQ